MPNTLVVTSTTQTFKEKQLADFGEMLIEMEEWYEDCVNIAPNIEREWGIKKLARIRERGDSWFVWVVTFTNVSVLLVYVFPAFHVGHALRGLRSREQLTQKQLADMIGAKPSHISEMEHEKRPIGKDMAKRLAKALKTNYKVFL